jgi:hypothetical protein
MALQKQGINIPFGQGIETKQDPNQVAAGKMLMLENAVFDTDGLLQKRNGFAEIGAQPSSGITTLATLNGSLLASSNNLYAYSADTTSWLNQGTVQPVGLEVQPLVRTSNSQTAPDMAMAPNGLVCVTYVESSQAYYRIIDSATGQLVVGATALPATAANPRAFFVGIYFVITFGATVAASPHLQYVAIPYNMPTSPTAATDITTAISAIGAAYDGYVANNNLYLAWNGNDGGGAIRFAYLSSGLTVSATKIVAGFAATLIALTADNSGSTPVIWCSFWTSTGNNGYSTALSQSLISILAPTQIIAGVAISELSLVATAGVANTIYQVTNNYTYVAVRSDYLQTRTCTVAGVLGTANTILRGVGLASKAFYGSDGNTYALVAYSGAYQPSYFLINFSGNVLCRLAYSNGTGYASSLVLPNVISNNGKYYVAYLLKDLLVSVNKAQGVANVAGIYSQSGVNLASFDIVTGTQSSSEIASSLHLTGGQLWQYDGIKPVEHGFHVWPEDVACTTATGSGALVAQQYYYSFCYEWTDGAGNLHRSSPSVPKGQITTTASSTNTLKVPTLRLTAKTGSNLVRIVGYRWSTAQQSYYQFTSITSPTANDTTVDFVTITDALADSAILGNTLLYTTGGVIENIAAPASTTSTLLKSRLWLVDAEDQNLLWYSKPVLAGTPVEMSDLFTLYVPPTIGTQGSTGKVRAISGMDDKLIIFKQNAIYYVTGNGPDITGANNDFSDATFITSTVGCANPGSIVFQPDGIMFQSDKGIWLLQRNLQTVYIGAPVQAYNNDTVLSAVQVPGTNQVRFNLDSGVVLMYDYQQGQWGTFSGVPGISSVIYNNTHTYLSNYGKVYTETSGAYLDGSNPVLIRFTTAWLKLTGLQGYQRAYAMYLLASYFSPHKLQVDIAYDYDSNTRQRTVITPTNYNGTYGSGALWGSDATFGGNSAVEQWRIFFATQKCQSLQITVTELYDASYGVVAGAGFTSSGINVLVGVKSSVPKLASGQSA